jgi:hypothetical protein
MECQRIKSIRNVDLVDVFYQIGPSSKIKCVIDNDISFVTEVRGEITGIMPVDNLAVKTIEFDEENVMIVILGLKK